MKWPVADKRAGSGVSVYRYANRKAGSGTIFGQSAIQLDRRASRKLVPDPFGPDSRERSTQGVERKWAKNYPLTSVKSGQMGSFLLCNRHKMIDSQVMSENDGKVQDLERLRVWWGILRQSVGNIEKEVTRCTIHK